jgi:transcriptional regulator of acetoin/glycerol metabolism
MFLDELVAELRGVPLAALPDIVAAVRGASASRKHGARAKKGVATSGFSEQTTRQIAELILAMPDGQGSKLGEIERAVVLHALETAGGNVSAAARLLGVDRKAMERRVAKAKSGR